MVIRRLIFLTFSFFCVPLVHSSQAASLSNLTTKEILAELKGLPQSFGHAESPYYDYHGNANEGLQTLMIRRFEVTEGVCKELDFVSFNTYPAYVASLFHVLATTKDPASIPFLERCLKGAKRKQVYDAWLTRWHQYLRGAAPSESIWLTGTNEWANFFCTWANSEKTQTNRLRVLKVMQGWLHDPQTQKYFTNLEQAPNGTSEEILLSQLYLRQHGKPLDRTRFASTIAALRKSSDGIKILIRYAGSIRDEAFVPSLIEIADDKIEEEFMTPQRALEAITFQRGILASSGWKAWFGVNGNKGRAVWMEEAGSQLISMATTNISDVNAILSKAIYNWDDPAMLPYMERLATFKQLRSQIAGWINLTYYEVPFLRNNLLPLAKTIRESNNEDLKDWAKNLMRKWDFFEPDRTSWEEFVRASNMHV
jgi:hypothetical protein